MEVTPQQLVEYIFNFSKKYDLLRERLNGQMPVGLRLTLQYPPESCEALLSDPEAIDLLRQTFDLVVMDGAFPDCAFAFPYASKAPFMYLNTVGGFYAYISISGSPSPYSITAPFFQPATERMTFWQRAESFFANLLLDMIAPVSNFY